MRCPTCGADSNHDQALEAMRAENVALARALAETQGSLNTLRALHIAQGRQLATANELGATLRQQSATLREQVETAWTTARALHDAHPAVKLLRQMWAANGSIGELMGAIPAVLGMLDGGRSGS